MKDRKILIGLRADDFRHHWDLQATQSLKRLVGLDLGIRSLLGSLANDFFYLNNIASSILVGPKQLPEIHQLLLEACQVLDLEVPQLYIQQNPVPNAYTLAMRGSRPFIVIHTSLIDLLTPEELQAVIAHELGHLKCEHGVYLTAANLLVIASGLFSNIGAVLAESIKGQMMEWLRCAEFSCDRAALLAVQDPNIVSSVLMKLSGGSPKLAPLLNLDAFIEQARSYETFSQSELGQVLRQTQTSQLTHPVPVLRAKEIDLWAGSVEYDHLLKRRGSVYNSKTDMGEWRNW
ncbi:MAG: M48 family metallopeptidase [Cyanobacteriota bacterium ELA615]